MTTEKIKSAKEILKAYLIYENIFDDEAAIINSGIWSYEEVIYSAMSYFAKQAVKVALETASEKIKTGYDFDGGWKSEAHPKGIVNDKVKSDILNCKQDILTKLNINRM